MHACPGRQFDNSTEQPGRRSNLYTGFIVRKRARFSVRAALERVREGGGPEEVGIHQYNVRRPESEGAGFEERHWRTSVAPVFADGGLRFIVCRTEDVAAQRHSGSRR